MELGVGTIVGGYVLQQKLGAGGMGAVYRARHPRLDRDVALKVLHPLAGADPDTRMRFAREADALCRLDQHPHIVDVLDRGQDGDLLWMTMRFVPGDDLHTAVATGGAFDPARALRIVDEVGQALDYAHDRGLLHRDVKPANILLRTDHTGTERALLTDFGVVKDMTDPGMLTQLGYPAATVAYAAPEQLEQGPLDQRADVYALGAVFFELLTGRRAFAAQDLGPLLYSVMHGPVPDARQLRPELPPALAAVLMRAMAKRPQDRYSSCAELVAAAREALTVPVARAPETVVPRRAVDPVTRELTRPAPSPSPPPPHRSRARWVAGLVALLALVAVGVTVYAITASGDDPAGDGSGSTTSSTVSTTAAQTFQSSAVGVGTCLDDGGAPTACDAPHAAEVFDASDCSQEVLLAYLGGAPGADVLRSDVVVQPGASRCTVAAPGVTLAASIANVLLTPGDDVWRKCLDELGREIPCSEPHTAEVIFVQQDATESLDCRARADTYIGRPFAQHEDDLQLLANGSTCVVAVRGSNVLTASLRRLGSGALPLG